LKTIFRISRYEVSKDSSPTYFPIMRMIKPLCKDVLKSFPSFPLPHGYLGFAPYDKVVGGYCLDKSRSGLACVTRSQGTHISRVSLDISETLCPSRVRPARQVLFHVFRSERRTPAGKMHHCWEVREVYISLH
jgi:hypothetical protein